MRGALDSVPPAASLAALALFLLAGIANIALKDSEIAPNVSRGWYGRYASVWASKPGMKARAPDASASQQSPYSHMLPSLNFMPASVGMSGFAAAKNSDGFVGTPVAMGKW